MQRRGKTAKHFELGDDATRPTLASIYHEEHTPQHWPPVTRLRNRDVAHTRVAASYTRASTAPAADLSGLRAADDLEQAADETYDYGATHWTEAGAADGYWAAEHELPNPDEYEPYDGEYELQEVYEQQAAGAQYAHGIAHPGTAMDVMYDEPYAEGQAYDPTATYPDHDYSYDYSYEEGGELAHPYQQKNAPGDNYEAEPDGFGARDVALHEPYRYQVNALEHVGYGESPPVPQPLQHDFVEVASDGLAEYEPDQGLPGAPEGVPQQHSPQPAQPYASAPYAGYGYVEAGGVVDAYADGDVPAAYADAGSVHAHSYADAADPQPDYAQSTFVPYPAADSDTPAADHATFVQGAVGSPHTHQRAPEALDNADAPALWPNPHLPSNSASLPAVAAWDGRPYATQPSAAADARSASPAGAWQPRAKIHLCARSSGAAEPHIPLRSSAPLSNARPTFAQPALSDDDLVFPKPRHPRHPGRLRNLFIAAGLLGVGFAARGLLEPKPAAAPPPALATTQPSAAEPAPVQSAQPAQRAQVSGDPEPATESAPAGEPSRRPEPTRRELARARRSAARAAVVAERWRKRHARGDDLAQTRDVMNSSAAAAPPPRASREPSLERASRPAPAAATGVLRINSRPWSQISIDGKWVGHTPQLNLVLPAGKHSVRLVNEPMGLSKTLNVTVVAGDTVTQTANLGE